MNIPLSNSLFPFKMSCYKMILFISFFLSFLSFFCLPVLCVCVRLCAFTRVRTCIISSVYSIYITLYVYNVLTKCRRETRPQPSSLTLKYREQTHKNKVANSLMLLSSSSHNSVLAYGRSATAKLLKGNAVTRVFCIFLTSSP